MFKAIILIRSRVKTLKNFNGKSLFFYFEFDLTPLLLFDFILMGFGFGTKKNLNRE